MSFIRFDHPSAMPHRSCFPSVALRAASHRAPSRNSRQKRWAAVAQSQVVGPGGGRHPTRGAGGGRLSSDVFAGPADDRAAGPSGDAVPPDDRADIVELVVASVVNTASQPELG